ncbi:MULTISPECIES: TetR/AcrR family transcriptional regulator [Rhodococcus]|jgi:AcrR family transcriptional regulator|uniref:TetR/AcrR family transcriptional regulator n=1 Tax=Rhodococcus oxybenzonivorans TaxID=1990687 RepID=A0AAE5A7M4_9NOCA|nr:MULTISPECIES: TetR/AcrR family transcriptional regulator [Rhodococcus]MDV7246161.1 TetR/AcrR family transcriptional regulator [Rhodococcus oxybenzonivorans]MDV7266857.1 TetR/AcrR family transcriptional regulator [Rhodococcus oxybenzonivorans]MDV7277876.1 TetR/AcrR family transcriptional regulator [Rhodococcus oxybenzonivorans]MDV7337174.1 TetR/AcrR family transcriptional regulator [Rhodococcus oxybenzonivorans]MDV7347473.1 TetR/AcrR family transcriptional regulator [Rhodococcus oxybenzonivo
MPDKVDTATSPLGDGRATRWEDHKAERRSRILDAAMDAINEDGPDVGVQQIAQRADVPRSVVYRIFTDRGDLDEQLRGRIIERLMADLAPTLTPEGTVGEAIARAVETYLAWIVEFPRLHQFLGTGSPSRRTTGSRVVTGTKTAIALQLAGLLAAVLEKVADNADLAEPLAFGLVGLVDASVNRWLSNPQSTLGSDEVAQFLEVSIWQVLQGNLQGIGVHIDLTTPVSELQ